MRRKREDWYDGKKKQQVHAIIRISKEIVRGLDSKFQEPFRGMCILCEKSMTLKDFGKPCENPHEYTEDDALAIMLRGQL